MNTGYNPIEELKRQLNIKFLLFCFTLGAISGSIGDYVHVVTKTDGYPHDGPFPFLPFLNVEMPIWVPFLFGGAVLVMGISHKLFSMQYKPRLVSNKTIVTFAPFLFITIYALSGIIHAGTGGWQDVWLATAAILFWWLFDRTIIGAGLALLTAIGGTLFEIFLVSVHGFFYYPEHSNLFGVPSWLPWLYVVASITVSLVVRWI
jgi:hypothetical protein